MSIEEALLGIKKEIETCIQTGINKKGKKENGLEAKQGLIRSSGIINYIHEYIKMDLAKKGIKEENIFPNIGNSSPELRLTGMLKQKKQDICVVPPNIEKIKTKVTWGPLAFENKYDKYGNELTRHILSINVRSQLSSLAKNSDTLFERTYAEALNLHEIHNDMCMGEVYLIPTHEYDDDAMKENRVAFKEKQVNLEKYISFFHSINARKDIHKEHHKYERCALLIVDFRHERPKLYQNLEELKWDGLVSPEFELSMREIDLNHFTLDLLNVYHERFNLLHLI